MNIQITATTVSPLFCVQLSELTLEEFEAVYPRAPWQRLVEVKCGNHIRAYGVHEGSIQTPMQIVITFCDYLEQNGNRGCFATIEPQFIAQLHRLFPGRFARVGQVFENPYKAVM